MTTPLGWRAARDARRRLTPLNERISARYRACESNGGHVKAGDFILRDLQALPVCAVCGVPIPSRRGWGGSTSSPRAGPA
jgi:hypothetical protein